MRCLARACTSSRSTSTWRSAMRTGWVRSIASSDLPSASSRMRRARRRSARPTRCDITYGTNNEFGFDYLRDNLAFRLEDQSAARARLRDRRRGGLDPDRRGAHAADHLRPRGREHRALPAHQSAGAAPETPAGGGRSGRFLRGGEKQAGAHHRGGPRARRAADDRGSGCCARARACTTRPTSA